MPAITRIGTTQRWSDVVIHNGTLYVVEVPATDTADIHQQTREVLEACSACWKPTAPASTRS